jgi:endo-1,4-beta-mannosidase
MLFSRLAFSALFTFFAIASASSSVGDASSLEIRGVDDSSVATRALPVTFSNDVHAGTNKNDRKQLTSAVRAHANSLPDNHIVKQADSAHVWKGPHRSPEDNRLHSTADFYQGNTHLTTHHIYHERRALPVTYSDEAKADTNKDQRKKITSAVRAHVKSLPDNHAVKQADSAHVRAGPHTSDSDSRVHSTVDFKQGDNHITTHHVYRRNLPVTYSPEAKADTNKDQRKKITSAVRAHVKGLPDDHIAKQADSAHVRAGPHTSDSDSRVHSTVDFKQGDNHLTTHHIY